MVIISGKTPSSLGIPLNTILIRLSDVEVSKFTPLGRPDTFTERLGSVQLDKAVASHGSIASSKHNIISDGGVLGMIMLQAAFSETHPSVSTGVFAGVLGHLSKRLFTPSLSSSFCDAAHPFSSTSSP